MAAVEDRTEERQEGATADGDREIRVPRLLVAGSEFSWRFIVCLAAAAILIYLIAQVAFVAIPVFIAFLLSTLLVPPTRFLQRRGLPPALATTVVFLVGVGALVGLITFVSTSVATQLDDLGEQVREGANQLGRRLAELPVGPSQQEIQQQIDSLDDRIRDNVGVLSQGLVSGAQAAGRFLAGLAIMLVVLFFLVKDGPRLWGWFCRLFPPHRRPALDEMADRSWTVLAAYVRGVVFVAFVDAVGIGLGLLIIGVPLVVPLAVITFLLAFIPIVGAILAGAAAVLVALVSEGVVAALLTLGVVVLVQQLESNVLYPIIVGHTVELHPLAVLLAVAVGGVLLGIIGAAIAVPLALLAVAAASTVQHHAVHGEVPVGPTPEPPRDDVSRDG